MEEAISSPFSVSVMKPAFDTTMQSFSRSFFIATLTLGFVTDSSSATSTERTTGRRLLKISMVSR